MRYMSAECEFRFKSSFSRRVLLNVPCRIASGMKPEQARKQLKLWLTSVSFGAEEELAVPRRIFAVAKANANATA